MVKEKRKNTSLEHSTLTNNPA